MLQNTQHLRCPEVGPPVSAAWETAPSGGRGRFRGGDGLGAGDSGYRISQMDIVGDDLFIEVSGSGDAPSARDLDDELDREGVELGRVSVAVRFEETSEG